MTNNEIENAIAGRDTFTLCDFSGECDACDNPKGVSFAVNYSNSECGMGCDYYVCKKCAEDMIKNFCKKEV